MDIEPPVPLPSKSVENQRLCEKAGAANDAANPMMKRYAAPKPLSNDVLRMEWNIERDCSGWCNRP